MKVGISFVKVADARANLGAEDRSWSVPDVAHAATVRWDDFLNRIQVAGGRTVDRATFYSALYRSLLHPNLFSDVNGDYKGFDGRVHLATGGAQYANFSGWDVYRSEVPLLAMIAPEETGDMMRSLLADRAQSGELPKLAFTDLEAAEMNGDSADPILAEASAFGVRSFDAREALGDMVKGATTPGTGTGWDAQRQDLDEYLSRGWIEGTDATGRRSTTRSAAPRPSSTPSTTSRSHASPTGSATGRPPRPSWREPRTGATSSTRRPAICRHATGAGRSRSGLRSRRRRSRASAKTAGRRATRSSTRGAFPRTSAASSTPWAATRWRPRDSTRSSPS